MVVMSESIARVPEAGRKEPLTDRIKRRAIVIAVAAAALLVSYLFVRYALSEWWVNWVADRVHRGYWRGLRWGFVLGFVPVLLALGFVRLAIMRRMPMAGRLTFVVLATVAALPLLLTLAVRAGSGASGLATRKQRILEDHAPWFTTGQVTGFAVGLLLVAALSLLVFRRRRRKRAAERSRAADQPDRSTPTG